MYVRVPRQTGAERPISCPQDFPCFEIRGAQESARPALLSTFCSFWKNQHRSLGNGGTVPPVLQRVPCQLLCSSRSSHPRENPAAVGVSQLRALAAAASDRFRRGVNSVSSARSHSASHNHILLGGPVSSSVNAAEGEGRPPRTQCLREDDQGDFLT